MGNQSALTGSEADQETLAEYFKTEREVEEAFIKKMERVRGEKATRRFAGFPSDEDLHNRVSPATLRERNTAAQPPTLQYLQALASAQPSKESTTTQHADGSVTTVFHQKVTSDKPTFETPASAPVLNAFPAPTTDRSRHLHTLAFLVDVASYWGHAFYVSIVWLTLSQMVTTYLPPVAWEDANKDIADFMNIMSSHAFETRAAVEKIKSFLERLWNAPKPGVGRNKGPAAVSHANFRTSYWIKGASEPLLKSLNLKK